MSPLQPAALTTRSNVAPSPTLAHPTSIPAPGFHFLWEFSFCFTEETDRNKGHLTVGPSECPECPGGPSRALQLPSPNQSQASLALSLSQGSQLPLGVSILWNQTRSVDPACLVSNPSPTT